MKKIEVRKADPSDALQLAKIHVETWQCAYRGQVPDDYLDGLSIEKRCQTWKDNLSKQDSNICTYIAEVAGALAGFCSVGKSRDDDADGVTKTEPRDGFNMHETRYEIKL